MSSMSELEREAQVKLLHFPYRHKRRRRRETGESEEGVRYLKVGPSRLLWKRTPLFLFALLELLIEFSEGSSSMFLD